jgi:hypothetical protein
MMYLLHYSLYACYFINVFIPLKLLNAKLSMLCFSRMVRPGARGHDANDPPSPDYMAGIMQQFELNRQFMQGLIDPFPRPNMNQQPNQVTLQDFMRLNPTVYRSSTQPLDADD